MTSFKGEVKVIEIALTNLLHQLNQSQKAVFLVDSMTAFEGDVNAIEIALTSLLH